MPITRFAEAAASSIRLAARVAVAFGAAGAEAGAWTLDLRLGRGNDARRAAHVRRWARRVLEAMGVDRVMDPHGPRDCARPATVVVANHRSLVDIPLVLSLCGGHILSRGDIRDWPLFGRWAELGGTVFVDRDDAQNGAAAIQRMREILRQRSTLCVFPEGTTYSDDQVRPFRPGAFVAVARERGSVLPVGIAYADRTSTYGDEPLLVHARRIAEARATRAAVMIGAPIAAERQGIRGLSERARDEVQALVNRARALL